MDKKHRPFSTGSQYADWSTSNCGTCKKGFDQRPDKGFRCDWEKELCIASVGNGQVTEDVAKAIGFLDSEGCDLWECPEWKRGRK